MKAEREIKMIILTAVIQAKPEKEQELKDLLKSLIPLVKEEKGTVEYILHSSKAVPGKFLFYEKYKDKQAYDDHSNNTHLRDVFRQFDGLVIEEPQVEFFEEVASIADLRLQKSIEKAR